MGKLWACLAVAMFAAGWNAGRALGQGPATQEAPAALEAKALISRGYGFQRAGQSEKALNDFNHVVDMPGAPAEQVAWALFYRGLTFGDMGLFLREVDDETRVTDMKDAPAEVTAWALEKRGRAYVELSEWHKALNDFNRIIDMKDAPATLVVTVLLDRGACYGTMGQWQKGVDDCTRVVEMNDIPAGQLAQALFSRGHAYAQLDESQKAVDDYRRVIDMKTESAEEVTQDERASIDLAQLYTSKLDQKETAERVIEDSLKVHPDSLTLVGIDARLKGMSPQDTYKVKVETVQKTADPFARQLRMFDLESGPGGHPEEAFGRLEEARKLKPDDEQVLDRMFTYYVDHKNFESAAPLVDKLADQNADKCGGRMYRYRLSLLRGDLAAAEDQARQLIRSYSEYPASWLVTAQVLQLRGKLDEAVHCYQEVLSREPGQYDAYRGLIECHLRLNQPEQAEVRMREARMRYPNDLALREQFLVYLVNSGKAAQAIPERESILAADKQQQKDVADDYLRLAKAYFHAAQDEATARPADSAEHLNKTLQALAEGKDRFPDDGRFPSQLAETYLYNRELDAGENVLMDFYHRRDLKDDSEPALLLADFYVRAGKVDKADLYLNEAITRAEKKDGSPDIADRIRLASLQAQGHKFDAAYNTLAGAGAGTDPAIIRQRLEIMISEGRREEARKELEAELARRDEPALRNLHASLLIDNKELEAALKELDHVLAVDPGNDAAIYLQSMVIARQGDAARAVSQLVGLRNRDPRNAQVRLLLGEIYSKSGKTGEAIREMEDALQKLPINREIRLALIQLYRSQVPLANEALNEVVKLCQAAEADPVLRSDPTWLREEALAYASMNPPQEVFSVKKWQQVIALAPNSPDYRREFVDLLIQFHEWAEIMNETDKLIRNKHDEWWLHYQRGMAMAHLGQKDESVEEFARALEVTDVQTAPAQYEFILRGLGENLGDDMTLKRLEPLLATDPDGRWHLLQASELKKEGKFQEAEKVVDALLADPLNKPAGRRVPLLRAKADICTAYANAEAKTPANSLAENLRARDAYVELLGITPEDVVFLNNLACLLSDKIPAPQGGPEQAKRYSTKAYDLVRSGPTPNFYIMDTQGWILTLCGGEDAANGLAILRQMIVDREDTKSFIEGRYHLGEAYLHAPKPDPASARKWLGEAMSLIAADEKEGRPVDLDLKEKVRASLGRVAEPAGSTN